MTLKIVKPELSSDESAFDVKAAKAAIIEGMVNATVMDIYGAVAVSSASDGDQVKSIYDDLVDELENLILIANTEAASGATIDTIIIAINEEAVNFSPLDLKTMMVEVYGSIPIWKQAMINTNET